MTLDNINKAKRFIKTDISRELIGESKELFDTLEFYYFYEVFPSHFHSTTAIVQYILYVYILFFIDMEKSLNWSTPPSIWYTYICKYICICMYLYVWDDFAVARVHFV